MSWKNQVLKHSKMNNLKTAILFVSLLIFNGFSCSSKQEDKSSDTTEEVSVTDETKNENLETSTKPEDNEASFVFGIDLSKYQGDEVSLLNENRTNLHFVICKATEGVTYTDPDFNKNWKLIVDNGFIRGAYHFYRTADDPQKQAANYLDAIRDIKQVDLPPVVDFEEGGIDPSQALRLMQSNLLLFLKTIEDQTNRKPIIYTNVTTGTKYLDNPRFSNYALWIADYTEKENPRLPDSWSSMGWTFWQKSSDYKIGDFKNDLDLFNGSSSDLKSFISKN